jgi:redox-sensitive bicupin YhaK (pirin superfamily)
MTTAPTIQVQRAAERFVTDAGWLDSKHSFNFGHHWSPEHQGHGLLLVNNDDVVAPGQGFGTHGHRDMEIVTWVLAGRLEHRDSTGTHDVIYPGLAQRMSAGRGIRHSEMNASPDEPVHFIQMWVLPDTAGVDPGYEQRDLTAELDRGGLVAVASGAGLPGAIHLHQRDATLWAARLSSGDSVVVPTAPHVHLFVALGAGALDAAGELGQGDAVRLTDAGPTTFTATADGTELLVWATA